MLKVSGNEIDNVLLFPGKVFLWFDNDYNGFPVVFVGFLKNE